jgi:hypothetical protein
MHMVAAGPAPWDADARLDRFVAVHDLLVEILGKDAQDRSIDALGRMYLLPTLRHGISPRRMPEYTLFRESPVS